MSCLHRHMPVGQQQQHIMHLTTCRISREALSYDSDSPADDMTGRRPDGGFDELWIVAQALANTPGECYVKVVRRRCIYSRAFGYTPGAA
eukprot:24028-Eustigmatos_ZCMA.PRE.1